VRSPCFSLYTSFASRKHHAFRRLLTLRCVLFAVPVTVQLLRCVLLPKPLFTTEALWRQKTDCITARRR